MDELILNVDIELWLNQRLQVRNELLEALYRLGGGSDFRYHLLENLAEGLGFTPTELEPGEGIPGAYLVLDAMLSPLGAVWDDPPGYLGAALKAQAVAEDTVVQVGSADLLLRAMEQFRFNPKIPATKRHMIVGELRRALASALSPRISKMLDRWQKMGAWEPGFGRPSPGIVTARSRPEPKATDI